MGLRFEPELELEKKWSVVVSELASLTQKWVERKLFLKGEAVITNIYVDLVI